MEAFVKVTLLAVFVICLLFGSFVFAGHEVTAHECITDACVELLEGGLN